MKKVFTLLFIGLITLTINAQTTNKQVKKSNDFTIKANPNAGVFEFESEVIDYGTIEQNADGKREFKFKNVGKSPIIISRAKGSCGCTVPTWPKKPIMPGETAVIGVKYDTKRVGNISKSITLYSNASEPTKVLRIKGKVLKTEVKAPIEKKKSLMSAQ